MTIIARHDHAHCISWHCSRNKGYKVIAIIINVSFLAYICNFDLSMRMPLANREKNVIFIIMKYRWGRIIARQRCVGRQEPAMNVKIFSNIGLDEAYEQE